jgi:tellurite resistance protein TerC
MNDRLVLGGTVFHSLLQSAPWWAWAGFHVLIFAMLALDLGVFNRKAHAPSAKEAIAWSVAWIALALLFNTLVWRLMGGTKASEWFTGYLLEKSLSVDNLFVFVLIFTAFQVESKNQHRLLYWGVVGALVMRAIMILAGTALIHRFNWMLYLFGAFLLYTGVKMLFFDEDGDKDPSQSWVTRSFQKLIPFDPEGGHTHFTIKKAGKLFATPMLMVLVVVEVTDLVFAVDSIPAVLGVTTDPFVVYTSNIFAILGLRSLYFLLARMLDRFHRLKLAVSMILVYIGVKMLAEPWLHIPNAYSLLLICAFLAGGIFSSLAWPQEHPKTKE